jgi:hypothetical protein
MQAEQVQSLRKSQSRLSRSGRLRTGAIFQEYDQILHIYTENQFLHRVDFKLKGMRCDLNHFWRARGI